MNSESLISGIVYDEPAKMSSTNDFFSDNIQVDLGDHGIWKAKGLDMEDSNHRDCLIWGAYLWPEINAITVAMQKFLSHFEVTLFLDLASTETEMPVEVHNLKMIFMIMLKLDQMIQSTSTTTNQLITL
jgi:hypothetical protein